MTGELSYLSRVASGEDTQAVLREAQREVDRLRGIAGDAFRSLQAGRLDEASEYLRGIGVLRG